MSQKPEYTNKILKKVNAELSLQLAKADQKIEKLEAKIAEANKILEQRHHIHSLDWNELEPLLQTLSGNETRVRK